MSLNTPRTPQVKRKASEEICTPHSEPKKRNVIDARTKMEIINKHQNGATSISIAKEYNLAPTTISTILKPDNVEKLVKLFAHNKITEDTKHLRLAAYPKIDQALDLWFSETRNQNNITIDGPLLKEKAILFAQKFRIEDFKASSGWLDNWKKRHNIVFKKSVGEAGFVDDSVVKKYLK